MQDIGDSSTVKGRDAIEGEGTEASKFGFRMILDVIIEILLMTQYLFYGYSASHPTVGTMEWGSSVGRSIPEKV